MSPQVSVGGENLNHQQRRFDQRRRPGSRVIRDYIRQAHTRFPNPRPDLDRYQNLPFVLVPVKPPT